jgi:predicted DNA binding CopG/RHH family protein
MSIFVVRREDYVYLVPFVEDDHTVFLKTIIPSRKATKEHLGEESMKRDADEKELLDSVERGEWKSANGSKRERTRYSRYAKATFRKDRRLNIRLSSKDLEAIQKRALAEGLPYQTLIASLLHKYAAGRRKRCSCRTATNPLSAVQIELSKTAQERLLQEVRGTARSWRNRLRPRSLSLELSGTDRRRSRATMRSAAAVS